MAEMSASRHQAIYASLMLNSALLAAYNLLSLANPCPA